MSLVFAGLQAMRESLEAARTSQAFDFFVLSDTTDPAIWREEEIAWRKIDSEPSSASNLASVYYRHRKENVGRKAGNVAEYCRRWGGRYSFMITLDADSLMEGETLAKMVRRMEADPQLGILQTSPLPLGQASILSRGQHFVCNLCGPMLTRGLAYLSGNRGNYWGHNAIIRTTLFAEHCGLAALQGSKPLGGDILSHDFVEAALMGRAGYHVELAWDLAGSYEQCPATLPEFLQRDQRWCQGNLQHSRLLIANAIPLMNRFHFLTGIMAYGSSVMWAAFVLLSIVVLPFLESKKVSGWLPLVVVAGLLLLPRGLAMLLVLGDRSTRQGFGGALGLASSTLFELALSVLAAPIFMLFHSLFVVSTLLGRTVSWNAQRRSTQAVRWRDAWRQTWWVVATGVLLTIIAAMLSTWLLAWLSPLLVGMLLAPVFSVLVSSARIGKLFKQFGFLKTPVEDQPPAIVQRFHQQLIGEPKDLLAKTPYSTKEFAVFIQDAALLNDHITILAATRAIKPADEKVLQAARQWAADGATCLLTPDQETALMHDPVALRKLHRQLTL